MSKVKFELNRAGVRELLRSPEMLKICHDAGEQALQRLVPGYQITSHTGKTLANTARIVTVGIVSRILRESTTGEPMISEMQTAGSYQWQGSYAIPGGGIVNAIMNSDLKALGLLRQRIGVIDPLRRRQTPSGEDSS